MFNEKHSKSEKKRLFRCKRNEKKICKSTAMLSSSLYMFVLLTLHAPSGNEGVSVAVMQWGLKNERKVSSYLSFVTKPEKLSPFEYEMHQTVKAFMAINFSLFLRFSIQSKHMQLTIIIICFQAAVCSRECLKMLKNIKTTFNKRMRCRAFLFARFKEQKLYLIS